MTTKDKLWKIYNNIEIDSILSDLEKQLEKMGMSKLKISILISENKEKIKVKNKSITSFESGLVFIYSVLN